MAEDWALLADEVDDEDDVLIGKIDCTKEHSRNLCLQFGVTSYPTLKYGDIINLQDYQGARDLDEFREVVEDDLMAGPLCSVSNPQLCEFSKRQSIEDLIHMGLPKLNQEIERVEKTTARLEGEKDKFVNNLRDKYSKGNAEKEKNKKELQQGLDLMKACLVLKKTHHQQQKPAKDEL
ncbi:Protein disulfide isomerase [Seminavis robusta]|uniref:Protein disulfide isomerase n=1 Tax=Seminavis robusta TaxID=568900 RepID=A0A9N8ELP1_9STRA|nr:Protein disulfide isomerase [Seminavis robusta]|eukprot:Sro1186_g250370.1 Protein disulfide isomerase (178) ;mRNA; r:26206-26739